MSEYTAIVSATYRILGEADDYTGSFSVTVDENTTALDLKNKIEEAVKQLDSVAANLGWGLLTHLSWNVARAQLESETPTADPHEEEQSDHGGWEDR